MAYTVKYGKGVTYIKDSGGVWQPVKSAWEKTGPTTWTPIKRANVKVDSSTWESVYPTPKGIPTLSTTALSFNPFQLRTYPDNGFGANTVSKPTKLTITNTGDYDLSIASITLNDAAGYQTIITNFAANTAVSTPITLVPGDTYDFGVRVRGLTAGTYTNGNIAFVSNTGAFGNVTSTVAMSTTVRPTYAAVITDPRSISLSYNVLDTPPAQTVTITNSGNGANLNIDSVSTVNGRVTLSAISTPIGYNFSTFTGNSTTFTVTAANLNVGTYTDTIVLTSSDLSSFYTMPVTVTVTRPHGRQVFDTPGTYTWTVPSGVHNINLLAVGGGGAGGPDMTNNYVLQGGSGGGGGSGGYSIGNNYAVTPGETLTITVGAGGAPNPVYSASRQWFPVSLSYAWSAFMNTYAVWTNPDAQTPVNETVSSSRVFTAPYTGNYTFVYAVDNYLTLDVDRVRTLNINGGFAGTDSSTVYLAQGNRVLTFNATNYGGPAGFAVAIKDGSNNTLWTTRTQLDVTVIDPGQPTTVTGSFGTVSVAGGANGGAAYDNGVPDTYSPDYGGYGGGEGGGD